MNQIHPYLLRVGNASDSDDVKALFDQRIRAVVQLAYEDPPIQLPRELIVCRFPLIDGPGNRAETLRLAITTLTELLREQMSVLVACSAGVSRAPAIAAAALARFTGKPLSACLREVAQYRHADIHPALYEHIEGVLSTLS
jgi:protein-tyrosine phosphatase